MINTQKINVKKRHMAQYIDKSTLVAEIERRIKETESMQPKFDQFWAGQISAFKGVLKILDTLGIKEVEGEPASNDLEEAARKAGQKYFPDEENIWARPNYGLSLIMTK